VDPPADRNRPITFPAVSLLLHDNSSRNPLAVGIPSPTMVPPSAFLTLSTVYASSNLAGLFHPARRVLGSPYRGFPRHSAALTRRQCVLS
jgi:hypothetical protein